MDEYYQAVSELPAWLSGPLLTLPEEVAAHVHEVRLRAGGMLAFTIDGAARSVAALVPRAPGLAPLGALRLTQLQMEELLYALCHGSLHTYENELAEGFLTLAGGHRVGVGGRYTCAVAGPDTPVLQTVTSLNLRIARRRSPTLPPALQALLKTHFTGLLLVGEPDSGKTTLLRGTVVFLAECGRGTAVIDEREELFPPPCGAREAAGGAFAAGCGWDVLSGVNKGRAVQMALRTLSPEVIVLDELGGLDEVTALEQGFFGGVDFVATLHAASLEEAERRPQVRYLRRRGMLHYACCLAGRRAPGEILGVEALC